MGSVQRNAPFLKMLEHGFASEVQLASQIKKSPVPTMGTGLIAGYQSLQKSAYCRTFRERRSIVTAPKARIESDVGSGTDGMVTDAPLLSYA